jgi:hypothetical protein
MTEDQIKEEMKKLGIDPGSWQKTEGGEAQEPEFIRRQKKRFAQVLPFLEKQLADDIQLLAQLKEAKKRVKYGGGM